MRTQHGLLVLALLSAAYIVIGLLRGRLPARGPSIKRSEQPGIFWFGIALAGLVCFGFTWGWLYYVLPPLLGWPGS